MTTTGAAARKYPRDLTVGTRVLVRAMTPRGIKNVPGTITEMSQDGGRYSVVVESDKGGTYRLHPAANAKLTIAPRREA